MGRRFAALRKSAAAGLVALLCPFAPDGLALAGVGSDCFPDRVVAYTVGTISSPPAFNSWQPGIVLGPPGSATPTTGSLDVLSLGHGGSITLAFTDNEIVDGPGPDFIVFENPFFCTAPPLTASDPWSSFSEPGIVEASDDGVTFHAFPYSAAALSMVVSSCSDKTLIAQLQGLAGLTPSFTGDWTTPDDPLVFDTAAPGGVSGHGGDAFDLATLGLTRARFIRITDPNLAIGVPGSSEGFDLDAVVALHARALLPGPDSDGDGLPDELETHLYLTNPGDPDTDGDGLSDGEEVAACHDPKSVSPDPFFLPEIDLEVPQATPTLVRWSTLGPGVTYDLVRGDLGALRSIGGMVDLGVVTCIENDSTDLSNRGLLDAAVPALGQGFFYLVRQTPRGSGLGYGLSSAFEPRVPASGDCQ
jgi:Bacterial TSP3 repeat